MKIKHKTYFPACRLLRALSLAVQGLMMLSEGETYCCVELQVPEALGLAGSPASVFLWVIIWEEDDDASSEGFAAAETPVVVPRPEPEDALTAGLNLMVVVVVVLVVWPYFSSSILDFNTWRWYSMLLRSALLAPVPARF